MFKADVRIISPRSSRTRYDCGNQRSSKFPRRARIKRQCATASSRMHAKCCSMFTSTGSFINLAAYQSLLGGGVRYGIDFMDHSTLTTSRLSTKILNINGEKTKHQQKVSILRLLCTHAQCARNHQWYARSRTCVLFRCFATDVSDMQDPQTNTRETTTDEDP